MKRVLFVDDEPNVLQGLRRMLWPLRSEWDMEFVDSGPKALEVMAQRPFDVVVTDMRMPDMDGAQLLGEVMRRYPQTVRIVLSGHSDKEMVMRLVGPAHQYLAKPTDPDTVKETVARACALRELLSSEQLKQLVAGIKSLPSIPALYTELVEELRSPDASIRNVGEIISKDVAMTAKILQLVNSAFFGLRQQVSSPAQAAGLLGLDTIQALVLSVKIFSEFDAGRVAHFSPERLWHHIMYTAASAKAIAKAEGLDRKMVDNAFTGGLLHDVGKLVLAANFPSQYGEAAAAASAKTRSMIELERETFGATHMEVGAFLLGIWGLPDPIVEVLAFHHQPRARPGREVGPLTAVHVADVFSHEMGAGTELGMPPELDQSYLKELGVENHLEKWRELCQATGNPT